MILNFFKYRLTFFLISLSLCFIKICMANPVGKALGCYTSSSELDSYKNFKGFKFETEKSVRVVSLKIKNNQLKVISKLTPYKLSAENIFFIIKFIWYGDIFFEEFTLNRKNLNMNYFSKGKKISLECNFIDEDFMREMEKVKKGYQRLHNKSLIKRSI